MMRGNGPYVNSTGDCAVFFMHDVFIVSPVTKSLGDPTVLESASFDS